MNWLVKLRCRMKRHPILTMPVSVSTDKMVSVTVIRYCECQKWMEVKRGGRDG